MNTLKRYAKTLFCSVGFLVTAFVAGCGGGGDPILGVPTVTAITVAPANPSIPNCCVQQFTATATFSDGTTRDVTTEAVWSSATPAVATVNADTGLARAVAPGTSVISAKFKGVTGSTTLTVTPLGVPMAALGAGSGSARGSA